MRNVLTYQNADLDSLRDCDFVPVGVACVLLRQFGHTAMEFCMAHPDLWHQFQLGDDDGCFAAALSAVREFGGVIEHPCDSHAWDAFCIPRPPRCGGWIYAGQGIGEAWTCCVYQGHYGHLSGKPTWLYVAGVPRHELPELRWGKTEQRLHPVALERHGYAKARRIGMMAMVGGKDKTRIRNATPTAFRDVLLSLARCSAMASLREKNHA